VPKRPNGPIEYGPKAMVDAPHVSSFLAAYINAWAVVEARMADMIEYLVSESSLRGNRRWLDPLGNAIYGDLKAFGPRLSLLRIVLRTRLGEQEYAKVQSDFEELYGRLSDASTKRNDYVHSIWGFSPEVPNHLIKSKPYSIMEDSLKQPKFVGVDTLVAKIDGLMKLAKDVREFDYKIRRRTEKNLPKWESSLESPQYEGRRELQIDAIRQRLEKMRQSQGQQGDAEPES
jgi:hypothetical protein